MMSRLFTSRAPVVIAEYDDKALYKSTTRRVYLTVRCPSVRLSVPTWALSSSKSAAAGLLLPAQRAGDMDQLLHSQRSAAAAGECGQCPVASVRKC